MQASPLPIRDRTIREERLRTGELHHLSLPQFVSQLEAEQEYEANGHTGMLLMRTDALRVVLECVRAGTEIAEHAVHGPAFVHVLSGSVLLTSGRESQVAERGEMLVIPRDRARRLRALSKASLLLAMAPDS